MRVVFETELNERNQTVDAVWITDEHPRANGKMVLVHRGRPIVYHPDDKIPFGTHKNAGDYVRSYVARLKLAVPKGWEPKPVADSKPVAEKKD